MQSQVQNSISLRTATSAATVQIQKLQNGCSESPPTNTFLPPYRALLTPRYGKNLQLSLRVKILSICIRKVRRSSLKSTLFFHQKEELSGLVPPYIYCKIQRLET